MYAPISYIKLRKDTDMESAKRIENEALAILHERNASREEISPVLFERQEVTHITFSNVRQSAEEYNRVTYPKMAGTLSEGIAGTLEIRRF
jgi:hypothetical protein